MKYTFPILLLVIFSGCNRSSEAPTPEKNLPRIEFIECDNSSPDFSSERKTYFNKEVKSTNDTTTISFDFVRDCCLQFEGKWRIEDGILTLSYHPKSGIQEPCDCKCTYSMKYHFNNKEYTWNRVKIRRGR